MSRDLSSGTMVLHLCQSCRRRATARARGQRDFVSVAALSARARAWARQHGVGLEVRLVSCLSGCHAGLCAMVERDDGMVRLAGVATATELEATLNGAPGLFERPAHGPGAGLVLSQTLWADWEEPF